MLTHTSPHSHSQLVKIAHVTIFIHVGMDMPLQNICMVICKSLNVFVVKPFIIAFPKSNIILLLSELLSINIVTDVLS